MAEGKRTSALLVCCFIFLCSLTQVTESIRCKCSTYNCPPDHIRETCTTDGQCFTKVEQDDNGLEYLTYGCLPPGAMSIIQCSVPDHVHANPLSLECCGNGDMCNTLLEPKLPTTDVQ